LFHNLNKFLERVFKDNSFIKSEDFNKEALTLIQNGRNLTTQKKYTPRLVNLAFQLKDLIKSIKGDESLNKLQTSVAQLSKDIGLTGPEGTPDLVKLASNADQLKLLLLPIFKKLLENVPLARVEIFSNDYDIAVDDLYMNGADILPEFLNLNFDSKVESDFRMKGKPTESKARLWLEIKGIKPTFKMFKFNYSRKTFPKLEDSGVANLLFTGKGIRFVVTWELEIVGGKAMLNLKSSKVTIDSLDLQILDAEKHKFFDKIAASMFQNTLKRKLSKTMEDFFYSKLGNVNDQLNTFFKERPMETFTMKALQPLTT